MRFKLTRTLELEVLGIARLMDHLFEEEVPSHLTFYEPVFIQLTFSRPHSSRIPDGCSLVLAFACIVSRTFVAAKNGESEQVFDYFIFTVPNPEFGNRNRTNAAAVKGATGDRTFMKRRTIIIS